MINLVYDLNLISNTQSLQSNKVLFYGFPAIRNLFSISDTDDLSNSTLKVNDLVYKNITINSILEIIHSNDSLSNIKLNLDQLLDFNDSSHGLLSFLNSKRLLDCELRFGQVLSVKVHRILLSRIEFFRVLFNSNFQDSSSSIVVVNEHFDRDEIDLLIRFLYTGQLESLWITESSDKPQKSLEDLVEATNITSKRSSTPNDLKQYRGKRGNKKSARVISVDPSDDRQRVKSIPLSKNSQPSDDRQRVRSNPLSKNSQPIHNLFISNNLKRISKLFKLADYLCYSTLYSQIEVLIIDYLDHSNTCTKQCPHLDHLLKVYQYFYKLNGNIASVSLKIIDNHWHIAFGNSWSTCSSSIRKVIIQRIVKVIGIENAFMEFQKYYIFKKSLRHVRFTEVEPEVSVIKETCLNHLINNLSKVVQSDHTFVRFLTKGTWQDEELLVEFFETINESNCVSLLNGVSIMLDLHVQTESHNLYGILYATQQQLIEYVGKRWMNVCLKSLTQTQLQSICEVGRISIVDIKNLQMRGTTRFHKKV